MSRPWKNVVVYCTDLVEAEQIAFLLRTRKWLACKAICKILDVAKHPEAELVIIVSLSREAIDFQPVVDAYCSCPVLVWHRTQGATMHEFFEAVDTMLAKKRGPKPQLYNPASPEKHYAAQTA